MLQGIGTLIGAAVVIFAAKLGANTFNSWRKQKLGERHIEQAERILTATYKARRALGFVRGIMVWAHELNAAEATLKEDPAWPSVAKGRQKRLVTAQASFNRLNDTREEQDALYQCLPMARALFGEAVEQALVDLHRQFWNVRVDAETYVDDDGSDPVFTKKIRRGMYDVGARAGETNETSDAISAALNAIEAACLPVLRYEEASTGLFHRRRSDK